MSVFRETAMIIRRDNNVGIGTTTPGGLFELNLDQGRKPSTNTWIITSDARLKDIEEGLHQRVA